MARELRRLLIDARPGLAATWPSMPRESATSRALLRYGNGDRFALFDGALARLLECRAARSAHRPAEQPPRPTPLFLKGPGPPPAAVRPCPTLAVAMPRLEWRRGGADGLRAGGRPAAAVCCRARHRGDSGGADGNAGRRSLREASEQMRAAVAARVGEAVQCPGSGWRQPWRAWPWIATSRRQELPRPPLASFWAHGPTPQRAAGRPQA